MTPALLAVSVLVLAASCSPSRQSAAQRENATSPDSVVGKVVEVGSDPTTWLVVQPQAGGKSMRLTGALITVLRTVGGAVVWLSGEQDADEFRVDRFAVRMVNDQPVDDGIVVVSGENVSLRLATGESRIVPNAPSAMRAMPGARVWLTRPVPGTAPSFGVIER